jgi:hypothetical protein
MRQFDDPHGLVRDDKATTAETRQVRAEQFMVAQMSPHPGHKVWEFDLETGEINEPKYERIDAKLEPVAIHSKARPVTMTANTHKKVIQRADCLYCSALNKKNAIKKFVPMYEALIQSGQLERQFIPNPTNNE